MNLLSAVQHTHSDCRIDENVNKKKNENVMLGHYTNSSHMRAERARAIFIQRQFGLSILSTLHMHELLGHSMALMLKLAHSHKI